MIRSRVSSRVKRLRAAWVVVVIKVMKYIIRHISALSNGRSAVGLKKAQRHIMRSESANESGCPGKMRDQLQDNLAAVELTLTQDELRQLDEVNALAPEYPGWVLPFQGAHRLGQVIAWSFTRGEPAALIQSMSMRSSFC
jgi:hypothetical protein